MSIFCEHLKEFRKINNITQIEMAKKIGVSSTQFQNYEYGKHEPTLGILVKIADTFNCSIDYLTGRTDNPEINK